MSTIPNTYAEAQAQGISYKAWLHMCEQEEIEREQAEDHTPERMSQVTDHEVELARAVLHCPEPIPEEVELAEAALNTPIARWIQGQLAMERWAS